VEENTDQGVLFFTEHLHWQKMLTMMFFIEHNGLPKSTEAKT